MRLYFVLSSSAHIESLNQMNVENILISYLNKNLVKKMVLDETKTIIIDSGAFTTWTKGIDIDIDKYIYFCHEIQMISKAKNVYCINLDVIPGRYGFIPNKEDIEKAAIQGWENYQKMKAAGLKVMHVFHQHEDFKWLDKLMEDDSDYIGISPANDLSSKKRLPWLQKVFSIVRQKKKTHGFGVTGTSLLRDIPFYSTDSSSWLSLVRYGNVAMYQDLLRGKKTLRYKNKEDAIELGFDIKSIGNDIESRRALRQQLNKVIASNLKMEKDITRLWEVRGVKWDN